MPGQVSSAEANGGNYAGSIGATTVASGISVSAIVIIAVAGVIGLIVFLKFRKGK